MKDMERIKHSLAHVLAHAVQSKFKGVKFGIGPGIENGFYYDFDLGETKLTNEDLESIENDMRKLIKGGLSFTRAEISKKEAEKVFKNEPYKLELISELTDGTISTYKVGEFLDLCKGPHIETTKELLDVGFKLTTVNGAYWRGDSNNKMLQRIYGLAFENKEKLKEYLALLEEAKKRDHRKLGPELELFMLDETAPGMPYWLPNGLTVFNTLVKFWREIHEREGYREFAGPQLNSVNLWKTSGHWEHYKDNMFAVANIDPAKEPEFALKPMSCPNAIKVFQARVRSYRELPLRFNDIDVIHRDERGGTLHGLMRVQMFRQDDSHNFITEEQTEAEFDSLFRIANEMYNVFGIKYTPVLSTRPKDFMGAKELWDKAENSLKRVLNKHFGEGNYVINEGDGAFYGPKIDLWMKDTLGRDWQTGTFQFDMQLPLKFDVVYTNNEGRQVNPIIVHRTIYGSLERFIGLLIENFTGAFPFWISPIQVGIATVKPEFNKYAIKVAEKLKEVGIRVELKGEDEGLGGKVNAFRKMKVPYTIVIGEKEAADKTVSLKIRGGESVNDVKLADFVKAAQKLNESKAIDLACKF